MKRSTYQAMLLSSWIDKTADVRKIRHLLTQPSGGWLKAVRQALGLSYREIGSAIGITPQSAASLEKSEMAETISIRSLRRYAHALDCDLVVALLPRHDNPDQVERAVAHTMDLENQPVPRKLTKSA